MSTLKAYAVTDDGGNGGDGAACVVFARHSVTARREGANQIDSEFEAVECRRAPTFDDFAPGPVPPLALVAAGWWFECVGCGQRVTDDSYHDDDECQPHEPVECGNWGVYCSADCRDDTVVEKAETKRRQIAAIADLTEFACRKWRGILIEGAPHAYVTRDSDKNYSWWSYPEVDVYFSFPGSRHGRVRLRQDRTGYIELLVPSGDCAAWNDWVAGRRGDIVEEAA